MRRRRCSPPTAPSKKRKRATTTFSSFERKTDVRVRGVVTKVFAPTEAVHKGRGRQARFEVTDADGAKWVFRGQLHASAFGMGLVVVEVEGHRLGFASAKFANDYAVRGIRYVPSIPTFAALQPWCELVARAFAFGRDPQAGLKKKAGTGGKRKRKKQKMAEPPPPPVAAAPTRRTATLAAQRVSSKVDKKKKELEELLQCSSSLAKALYRMIVAETTAFRKEGAKGAVRAAETATKPPKEEVPALAPNWEKFRFKAKGEAATQPPSSSSSSSSSSHSSSFSSRDTMKSFPALLFAARRQRKRTPFSLLDGRGSGPRAPPKFSKGAAPQPNETVPLLAVFRRVAGAGARFHKYRTYPWARALLESGSPLATFWASQFAPLMLRLFRGSALEQTSFASWTNLHTSLCLSQGTVSYMLPRANTLPTGTGRVVARKRRVQPSDTPLDLNVLQDRDRPVLDLLDVVALGFSQDPTPPQSSSGAGAAPAAMTASAMAQAYRAGRSAAAFAAGPGPKAAPQVFDVGVPLFVFTRMSDEWFRAMLFLALFTHCARETASTAIVLGADNRLLWPDRIARHYDGRDSYSGGSAHDREASSADRLRDLVEKLQRLSTAREKELAARPEVHRPPPPKADPLQQVEAAGAAFLWMAKEEEDDDESVGQFFSPEDDSEDDDDLFGDEPVCEEDELSPPLSPADARTAEQIRHDALFKAAFERKKGDTLVSALVTDHKEEVDLLCAHSILVQVDRPPMFPGRPATHFILRHDDWEDSKHAIWAIGEFTRRAREHEAKATFRVEGQEYCHSWMAPHFSTRGSWEKGESPAQFAGRRRQARANVTRLLGKGPKRLTESQADTLLARNTPSLRMPKCGPEQADALQAIKDHPVVMVTGDPGTGKSTILSAFQFIPELSREEVGRSPAGPGERRRVQNANILGLTPTILMTECNTKRFGGMWRNTANFHKYFSSNPNSCMDHYTRCRMVVVDEVGMISVKHLIAILEFALGMSPDETGEREEEELGDVEKEEASPVPEAPPAAWATGLSKDAWHNIRAEREARRQRAEAGQQGETERLLTRLVVIGDGNQLPSVDPGDVVEVLRELAGVKHMRLTQNYRAQSADLVKLTDLFCKEADATRLEDLAQRQWFAAGGGAASSAGVDVARRVAAHNSQLAARREATERGRAARRATHTRKVAAIVNRCWQTPGAAGRSDSLSVFEMSEATLQACVADMVAVLRSDQRSEAHGLSFTNKVAVRLHHLIGCALGLGRQPGDVKLARDRIVVGQRIQFCKSWPAKPHSRFHNQNLLDVLRIEDRYPSGGAPVQLTNTDSPYNPGVCTRYVTLAYVGTGTLPAPQVTLPWSPDLLDCIYADKGFFTTVHTMQGNQGKHIFFCTTGIDKNPLVLTGVSRASDRLWVYAASAFATSSAYAAFEGSGLAVKMLCDSMFRFPLSRNTAFSLAQQEQVWTAADLALQG
jgi:hypothetical protein